MTKNLIIIDGKTAKCYRLGKNNRPMTTVRGRLFRTDDGLFFGQEDSSDSMVIYNLDDTQPYSESSDVYLDPDKTMALIDVGKSGKNKYGGLVEQVKNMDGMKWVYIAVAVIIVLSVAGIV